MKFLDMIGALALACVLLTFASPAFAAASGQPFFPGPDEGISLMAALSSAVALSLAILMLLAARPIFKKCLVVLAVACSLFAAGCTTSQTSSTGWGQIAAGVGAVLGETRIDPQIERVSTKLAAYCVEAQTAALAVDLLAPPKVQRAAQDARVVVATFCASPPRNVAGALASLAAAYAAIVQARAGS